MSSTLDEARRRYAQTICETAEVSAPELLAAFATVPREHFLGQGPWMIAQPFDAEHPYRPTATDDPTEVLQDLLIGVDLARQLNNGQPSAHARWIGAVLPRPGESVLHVGCGVGYYSALLAHLVGAAGKVRAVEVDAGLAARAKVLLAPWPQVTVEHSDASKPVGLFDVLYVNAGATHARPEWLDALAPGGRLLLPLTAHVPGLLPNPSGGPIHHGVGAVYRIERTAAGYAARMVSPVGIFDCDNARDERHEPALMALLDFDTASKVTALERSPHPPDARCVVHLDGFCLRAGG